MNHKRSLIRLSGLAFAVSSIFFSTAIYAAGFQINETSPGLQGAAMAGAAAANNDVSALFINPSTLATLAQNQIYLGASEIFPKISLKNGNAIHTVNIPGIPPSSISAPVQGSHSQGSIAKSAFVPDAYLGWRLTDRLVAGIAIVAPFGLTTKYTKDSALRFAAEYSSVETIMLNPAIAYSINKKWAVGLGVQAQYIQATFSNYNGPYTGISSIDALIAATQPTYLKGSAWGVGYTAGVLFRPDEYTRLGAGYRSQVSEQLSGNGQQYTSPGGTVPAPSPDFLFNAQTSVKAAMKTPAVLTLSAARDMANWTLKASAQLNFWNTFNQLSIYMPNAFATNSTIQTHWRNAWFGALGADYHFPSPWTVRGGVAYDQTPTQNAYRDPRIPDADRIWLTAGASYQISKHVSIDAAYAHIFVHDPKVDMTQASGASANSTVPLEVNQVNANYKGSIDVLALALRYSFL